MKKLFPLIFYLISVVLIAQPESYIKFPHQSDNSSITFSQLISVDDALLIFYADSNKLMLSKSLDEGTNWQEPEILYDSLKIEDPNLSAIRLKSGRILISYNENPTRLIYSDDNAISWSESIDMNLGFAVVNIKNPSFVEINNQVWYYFNITNRIYYSSSIDGISWDGNRTKISDLDYNYKTSIESYENNAVAILNITEDNFNKLYFSVSTDSAKSWNEKQLLINSNSELQNSILKITEEGILYLFYEEVSSPFHESIYSPDIKYITANINDLIWSDPIKITNYVANDNLQSAANNNSDFYLSFGSSRSNILLANSQNSIQFDNIGDFNFLSDEYDSELFVGKLNYSNDLLTPPLISELNTHFYFYYPKSSFVLRAVVIDDNEVNNVKVNLTINNNKSFHLEMNDTGINGDEISFDNIYSVRIDSLNIDDSLKINLLAADVNENTVLTDTITLVPRFYNPNNAYLIDVNKISIPIDNKGIIGNVTIYDTLGNSRAGGHFEEGVFVYSGGFMLSGYSNGELWANGVASASRI
ncbi:MAG: hypothetical protein KDC88_16845, partial [Ignavibacteriae bacterium]|nr:hypothetical protein [Ignavibacteriota bacterium]